MSLELLILFLAVIVILNWMRFHDVLYPGLLQSGIWLSVVVFLYTYKYRFIEVSGETLTLIFLGTVVFSLGSAWITRRHTPWMKPTLPRASSLPGPLITRLVFLAPLLGLPFLAWKAHQLERLSLAHVSSRYLDFRWRNLRQAFVGTGQESVGYGLLAYLFTPAILVTCIYLFTLLLRRRKTDLIFFSAAFLMTASYIVLSTGRTYIFLLIITLVFVVLTLRQLPAGRTLAVAFLFLAGMFFVVGVVMLKGGSLQYSFGDNLASMYDNFLSYFIAPTVAFDQVVHSARGSGEFMSLRFFYAVGKALGMDVNVRPLIEPFTYVPRPVNVYTFYEPYFVDFGFVGAVAAQLVVGLWHGWLYRRGTVERPKAGDVFLFSVFTYALFIQFFNDSYVTGLSLWLQYVGLSILFFWVLRDRNARPQAIEQRAASERGRKYPRGPKGRLAFPHRPGRWANGRGGP